MSYDELIKRLRVFCEGCKLWDGCKCCLKCECSQQKSLQAADAIEELQKDLERSKDFEAFWQHEAEEALKKFQVAISNKPRWIPVTERLPEEYEYVLCRTDYGMEVGYHRNEWGQDEWTTGKLGSGTIDVSHWMPLPQPPKDGEP